MMKRDQAAEGRTRRAARERRREDEARRQSEERLQLALDAGQIGTFEWNIRTDQASWDERVYRFFGLAPGAFGGTYHDFLDLVHPEDQPGIRQAMARTLEQGAVFNVEYRIVRPDAHVCWLAARGQLVRNEAGQPLRMTGVVHDVTERKRAAKALRDSEERHRLISDLTSDYAYTCRVEADGAVILESVTEGFARVTGYTLEEVEARGGWVSFIHPEDVPGTQERMGPLLAGKRSENELRIITKSGATRWVRYSTLPLWDEGHGRVVRLVGAVQDITDRKQAEEKMQEYARCLRALPQRLLEVQESERRHLARELHDEIGQLLTGLQLTLEMGPRSTAGDGAERLGLALKLIQDLAARVRDLSLRLRPTMLDDLGLLPALLWHFERYGAQTGVAVAFRHAGLESRFAPEVETAAYRIVQEALTNVARHAGVKEVAVGLWADRDNLIIRIDDQGHGFAVEAPPRSSSGLTGMRERALLLGGHLAVQSKPGAGTSLTAELPLVEARNGAGSHEPENHHRAGG